MLSGFWDFEWCGCLTRSHGGQSVLSPLEDMFWGCDNVIGAAHPLVVYLIIVLSLQRAILSFWTLYIYLFIHILITHTIIASLFHALHKGYFGFIHLATLQCMVIIFNKHWILSHLFCLHECCQWFQLKKMLSIIKTKN